MAINCYLAYDHTETHNGKDYYFFRIGLFHGELFTDLLLLLSDVNGIELLNLPSIVPSFLASGTVVQSFDGSSFTVPADIYLRFIKDKSCSPDILPLNFLENGFLSSALAVYAEIPSGEPGAEYPPNYHPVSDKPPNIPEHAGWYVPPGLSSEQLHITWKHTDSPL